MEKSIGRSWDEVRKELFTSKEIEESDLRVLKIGELIKINEERRENDKTRNI
ncbi:hypothetical protein [Fusobacterium necrophorum]|uniref:hypothetical protein n=1 Tax=Fusobacterium necrophorum TaxID=859 RepID=UPI00164E22EC|nr:hypothetical protein [Fusobacterium necrophorum]MCF0163390.1 hypothetical protein [Fusobacterium necrophorum]MDK4486313.1 hypothetical protein [Fusobacterium necrophorum]MDK4496674.1 hypothetical protein [Fusobacterium necrophorum]